MFWGELLTDNVYSFVLAALVLIFGITLSSLIKNLYTQYHISKNKNISPKRSYLIKIVNFVIISLTLIISIVFLQGDIIDTFLLNIYQVLPNFIAIILLLVLSIIIVRFLTSTVDFFIRQLSIYDYLEATGNEGVYKFFLAIASSIFYLILLIIIINIYGLDVQLVSLMVIALIVICFALAGFLVFYAFKDGASDIGAGLMLKLSQTVKVGRKIQFEGKSGEIRNITSAVTIIHTDDGQIMRVPNHKLIQNTVTFEKTKSELETLEEIQAHYVAQKPSMCGPTSVSMALSIFGYEVSADDLAQKYEKKTKQSILGKGTKPTVLGTMVEKETKQKVLTAWIDADHITNLRQELSHWLKDGALVIVDFKKDVVFPDSKKAHYALCIGVEGNELLILDPSAEKGGVYYVDSGRIYKGMDTFSQLIGGKRGYLVLAPRGTPSYLRVKEGLIYMEKEFYEVLTRTLEKKLDALIKVPLGFEKVLPDPMKKYLNSWGKKDKVVSVWRKKV